mmetsp:Transcript_122340/g.391365  ORF Transcript_122340/g.391365 Transcript_122340/m.391365 type:complete len:239 (+) Transcript_122340:3620-4336(+)
MGLCLRHFLSTRIVPPASMQELWQVAVAAPSALQAAWHLSLEATRLVWIVPWEGSLQRMVAMLVTSARLAHSHQLKVLSARLAVQDGLPRQRAASALPAPVGLSLQQEVVIVMHVLLVVLHLASATVNAWHALLVHMLLCPRARIAPSVALDDLPLQTEKTLAACVPMEHSPHMVARCACRANLDGLPPRKALIVIFAHQADLQPLGALFVRCVFLAALHIRTGAVFAICANLELTQV